MATRKQLADLKALAQRAVDAGDDVTALETRGVLATQKISSTLLSNSYRTVGEVAETILVNADEILDIKGLGEGRIHTLLSVALASAGKPTETGMRQIPDIDLEKPVFSAEARLWHNAFIGKTGSGKTYAARGEIEDIIEAGGQVIIIDPTGAWSGLRMRPDGSPSGYDIAIFGGQYGDRPLIPDMASALGRIAGRTRRSMILDLSGISLEIEDQREIVHEFLKSLYRTNRKPIHLVIDEADEFSPQDLEKDTRALRSTVARIMARGRSLGFRCTLITQRPAKIDKNSISQVESMAVLRVTAPQDRKSITEWFDDKGGEGSHQALAGLGSLRTGEGWVFTGVEQTYAHRQFRKNRTYDSSQTPIDEEGREIILDTGPIDLADFDEHLAYPDEATDEELEKANTKRRNLELDNRKLRVRLLKSESRYEAMRRVFVEIRHLIDGLLIDTQIDAVEYADLVALRDEVAADMAAQEFGVDLNDIHGVPIAAGDVREVPVAEEKESLLGERREWRLPNRKTTYVDIEVMQAVKSHKGSVEDIAKYTGLTIKAFQNSFDRLIEEGSIVRDGEILRLGANSYARRLSEKQMVTLVRLKDADDLDLSIINQRTLQSLSKLGLIKDAALTALGDLAVRCVEDNFVLDGETLISKFPLETGKA